MNDASFVNDTFSRVQTKPVLSFQRVLGDVAGAFADGGILFPLLVMLSFQSAFYTPKLFASAGAAYILAGLVFKVPMSVQPLKAIAIAAIAVGASGAEIRISGFLLGLFCLLITWSNIDRWAKTVPTSVIHCVQLGLGVLLIVQGAGGIAGSSVAVIAIALALFALICALTSYPILGLLAAMGLVASLVFPAILPPMMVNTGTQANTGVRFMIIVSLLLPQMALTLTNSVVATSDVAQRYFGMRAERVTERHLLLSIGLGNIVSALWGGLPYCHGSGGVTAHYRGGARTALSNYVIGLFLLALAAYSLISKKPILIGYPAYLLASLLMAVGFFHMGLAKTTWAGTAGKIQLIAAALAALLTHNMLVVLAVAVCGELMISKMGMRLMQAEKS